jgi:hypothetical protein
MLELKSLRQLLEIMPTCGQTRKERSVSFELVNADGSDNYGEMYYLARPALMVFIVDLLPDALSAFLV